MSDFNNSITTTNLLKPFYVTIESSLLLDTNLSNTDKIVYGIISVFSINNSGYCFLRYSTISKYAGIKKRDLYYCIKRLTEKNYIKKINKGDRVYLTPVSMQFLRLRDQGRLPEWFNQNIEEDTATAEEQEEFRNRLGL